MRSALAYTPRPGPLQGAAPLPALVFCSSFAVVAFCFSSPIVLASAGAGVVAVGVAAGAGRALAAALRWGLALAVLIVAVNALVTHRGETVLVRGPEVPVIGPIDVTLESIAAGGVIALRILVVLGAFAVYSACVDPDRVLRVLRPLAHRSALTATLVARLVPVAARDAARLREAAALRGPGAEPVGRAELARRLVAGSLDRAVDAAATLELRGYGLEGRAAPRRARSRRDGRFLAAGLAVGLGGAVARLAGVGGFDAYPSLAMEIDAATLGLAAALPLVALVPFARLSRRAPRVARAPAPGAARA